jgi:hypothetical protein
VDEKQEKCISTGISLLRDNLSFREATPILFRTNLHDVPDEEFKVPFSELAMHTKAAGKEIAALFSTPRVAFISYIEEDGSCGLTYGSISEVLSPELANRIMSSYFPEYSKAPRRD